jgi:hypothetical protein
MIHPKLLRLTLIEWRYYVSYKNVVNRMVKCHLAELGGRSKLEALYNELEKDIRNSVANPAFPHPVDSEGRPITYFAHTQKNVQGHLDALFWAHPYAMNMLKEHSDIIMLDCTYKTNKFNMLFLHICSITSMDKTFDVAFAFMANKEEFPS